jgi:hypothetical protein
VTPPDPAAISTRSSPESRPARELDTLERRRREQRLEIQHFSQAEARAQQPPCLSRAGGIDESCDQPASKRGIIPVDVDDETDERWAAGRMSRRGLKARRHERPCAAVSQVSARHHEAPDGCARRSTIVC